MEKIVFVWIQSGSLKIVLRPNWISRKYNL